MAQGVLQEPTQSEMAVFLCTYSGGGYHKEKFKLTNTYLECILMSDDPPKGPAHGASEHLLNDYLSDDYLSGNSHNNEPKWKIALQRYCIDPNLR